MMPMILSNKNKRILLGIILLLTISTIGILFLLSKSRKYQDLVISKKKWNEIITSREESTKLNIQSLKFNDYNLIIDEKNSIIYYSIVNSSSKYNPSIQYKSNHTKIAINQEITDNVLETTKVLKIMLYNKSSYRIYSLMITKDPILNVRKKVNDHKNKTIVDIELFDNHEDATQRVLKTKGIWKTIENNQEYLIFLTKESLGHNRRKNNISILGMPKEDEYILRKEVNEENEKKVKLFINNQYIGRYCLMPTIERRVR